MQLTQVRITLMRITYCKICISDSEVKPSQKLMAVEDPWFLESVTEIS